MKNKDTVQRRDFLKASAVGLGALATSRVPSLFAKSSPNERVVVAVMGLNGRGMVHARSFARGANTTVAYLCDVDSNVLAKAMSSTAKDQATAPQGIGDFRRALDDKNVDSLVIAAPDHWHTPATMLALQAGKHVYVEKPSGHDPQEDQMIVA